MIRLTRSRKEELMDTNNLSLLAQLRKKNELTDLTIVCDDGTFHVHKILFLEASAKMKAFFFSDEKSTCGVGSVLLVNCIYASDLQKIIEYLYTGEVTFPVKNLEPYLQACSYIGIDGTPLLQLDIDKGDQSEQCWTGNTAEELAEKTSVALKAFTLANERRVANNADRVGIRKAEAMVKPNTAIIDIDRMKHLHPGAPELFSQIFYCERSISPLRQSPTASTIVPLVADFLQSNETFADVRKLLPRFSSTHLGSQLRPVNRAVAPKPRAVNKHRPRIVVQKTPQTPFAPTKKRGPKKKPICIGDLVEKLEKEKSSSSQESSSGNGTKSSGSGSSNKDAKQGLTQPGKLNAGIQADLEFSVIKETTEQEEFPDSDESILPPLPGEKDKRRKDPAIIGNNLFATPTPGYNVGKGVQKHKGEIEKHVEEAIERVLANAQTLVNIVKKAPGVLPTYPRPGMIKPKGKSLGNVGNVKSVTPGGSL